MTFEFAQLPDIRVRPMNDCRTVDDALRDIRCGAIPANLDLAVAIEAYMAVANEPAQLQYRALRSVFLATPANIEECRERVTFFDDLPATAWDCFDCLDRPTGENVREAILRCLRSEIAMRLSD